MPKINQEEYELLKSLDDEWKWIARDKNEEIAAYENKPTKKWTLVSGNQWDITEISQDWKTLNRKLFQFIQWEDGEPYNIAELIKEYEEDYKGSWEHAIKFSGEVFGESEETEVKDLEWLKRSIDKRIKTIESDDITFVGSEYYDEGYIDGMRDVLYRINQLDEPEVLSSDWIDEHKENWQGLSITGYSVPEKDLQNLLVPKQEEVDQAYKDGYETGKQHTLYKGYLEGLEDKGSEPETIADVVTTFWKSYERLKEVMSMEVEETEE